MGIDDVVNRTPQPYKPLGGKAYGSIPHLPGSRLGPGDHHCHAGQSEICTVKTRDKHDLIIVQEKLDGSCCAVYRSGTEILALGRAGHLAQTSPYRQHQLFAAWVRANRDRFLALLGDTERAVGEWLAQAHGTRYALTHEPFIIFDLISLDREKGGKPQRVVNFDLEVRTHQQGFRTPYTVHAGHALPLAEALARLGSHGRHGSIDPVEGVVYRVERKGEVDFLAKYVNPDKRDGCYLPEVSKVDAIWNWQPQPEDARFSEPARV